MGDRVRRYLVTADVRPRIEVHLYTGMYANWIEGRAAPGATKDNDRETWLVTVYGEHADNFLNAARGVPGVTVEEIEGADDTETYLLRVGEPGTGWKSEG